MAPPSAARDWSNHFRVTQGVLAGEPMLTKEQIETMLADVTSELEVAGELEEGCSDPLHADDDAARARARALFKGKLDVHGVKHRPTSKDKKCVCLFCARELPVNSSKLALHVAADCVDDHPQLEEMVKKAVELKSLNNLVGAEKVQLVKQRHAQFQSSSAGSTSAQGPRKRACGASAADDGDVARHMDRELTDDEVDSVDRSLARMVYREGLPFSVLSSPDLHEALGKLNSSFAAKTKLSDWNVRHSFLSDEYAKVSDDVMAAITSAFALTLISDGWSGVQKEHQLNILLATPTPFFLKNVFTKVRAAADDDRAGDCAQLMCSMRTPPCCHCAPPHARDLRRPTTSTASTSLRSSMRCACFLNSLRW